MKSSLLFSCKCNCETLNRMSITAHLCNSKPEFYILGIICEGIEAERDASMFYAYLQLSNYHRISRGILLFHPAVSFETICSHCSSQHDLDNTLAYRFKNLLHRNRSRESSSFILDGIYVRRDKFSRLLTLTFRLFPFGHPGFLNRVIRQDFLSFEKTDGCGFSSVLFVLRIFRKRKSRSTPTNTKSRSFVTGRRVDVRNKKDKKKGSRTRSRGTRIVRSEEELSRTHRG